MEMIFYESGLGKKVGTITMLSPGSTPSRWIVTDAPREKDDTSSYVIKVDEDDKFSLWSIGLHTLGVSDKGHNDIYVFPSLISHDIRKVKLGSPKVDVMRFQLETSHYISDMMVNDRVIEIVRNDTGYFISIGFESNEDFLAWKLKQ